MAYNYEYPYTDPHRYNDDWLLKKMQDLLTDMDSLSAWKEEHEAEYQELKDLYDQVLSGDFPDSIKEAFTLWMQENGLDLLGSLAKMVFFGIDENGYFVAYIPEYWEDITFNTTGYDLSLSGYDYGHLVLNY